MHDSVYVLCEVRAGVWVVPDRPELETPGPAMEQPVTLLADHVMVEASPERTVAGFAVTERPAVLTVTFTVA